MAPPSGRKHAVEAPPPPPVDPRCKHAADVPPDSIGSFTLDGKRITTPSGAVFRPAATSFPASSASRQCRSLADGALLVASSSSAPVSVAKSVAKQSLSDRALDAPASAPPHKKSPPALSSFINEHVCFELVPAFIAQMNSLNASNIFEQSQIAKNKDATITFSSTAKETLKKGVASLIPSLMRFHTFDQAKSCDDFPRFTAILPNPKKHSPIRRACTFVAALAALKIACDASDDKNSLETEGKFSFENKMKENLPGVSSTFRHGVVPSSLLPSSVASDAPKYASTFVDGPRSIILHRKGFYWKIPDVSSASSFSLPETASIVCKQIVKATSTFDFSSRRRNDVDLAQLTRCSAVGDCENVMRIVGGVCGSNRECLRDAFTSCGISLSFIAAERKADDEHEQCVASPPTTGVLSFAPIGLCVNENDGTITMTVSCSFVNDSCAAALVQWVARVAGEVPFADEAAAQLAAVVATGVDETEDGSQRPDDEDEDEDEEEDPELVEVVRVKASALPNNINSNINQGNSNIKDADRQPGGSSSPSRQGFTTAATARRGSSPPASTRPAAANNEISSNTTLRNSLAPVPRASGASAAEQQQQQQQQQVTTTNENGNLERVTIPVPPHKLPEPQLLSIWVPRTVQVPSLVLIKTSSHSFTIPALRSTKSLYFAAALALWDETTSSSASTASSSSFPPDVLMWNHGQSGTEPFFHLCRSKNIDCFLQAARCAGQPSLGPHDHDLSVLHQRAVKELDEMAKSDYQKNATLPFISVLGAMSCLKMIDSFSAEGFSRFANPAIVVAEAEQGMDESVLISGRYLHQPILPIAGLFSKGGIESTTRTSFSLQISRSLGKRRGGVAAGEVSCIFTAPMEFERAHNVCRTIAAFASVIDKY